MQERSSARSSLLLLRFGRLLRRQAGQAPTRLASESSPSRTSNYGRPGRLLEDTAEANGVRRPQCRFAHESGAVSGGANASLLVVVRSERLTLELGDACMYGRKDERA